jgi:sulfatase maturation enzyme AslB (radical SAM superfamily)
MSVITLEGLPETAQKPIRRVRQSIYIEPISSCNLACKMCYTNVINGENRRIVDQATVLDFARRYVQGTPGQVWLYWCGTGEVMLHREFPEMVNTLLAEFPEERLTQTIQTNGTVRRLKEFTSVERLDFNISIDGSKEFHEWHRGKNTYDRTIGFCREAFDRGARSVLVRMLLTKDNIWDLDEFQAELKEKIGPKVGLGLTVPYTNRELKGVRRRAQAIHQAEIEDNRALSRDEALEILRTRYDNRYELDEDPEAVDNSLSLTTYGVHSCCHGIIRLGDATMPVDDLWRRLEKSEAACRNCSMFPCM